MHNKKHIRMITNARGADDGIRIHDYHAGKEYHVSESLAKNFVAMNVAEHIGEKSDHPPANKALDESDYKNKSDKRGK